MRKYRCQTTCWCSGPLPRGWALEAHPPPRGPRDGAGLDVPAPRLDRGGDTGVALGWRPERRRGPAASSAADKGGPSQQQRRSRGAPPPPGPQRGHPAGGTPGTVRTPARSTAASSPTGPQGSGRPAPLRSPGAAKGPRGGREKGGRGGDAERWAGGAHGNKEGAAYPEPPGGAAGAAGEAGFR